VDIVEQMFKIRSCMEILVTVNYIKIYTTCQSYRLRKIININNTDYKSRQ